MTKSTRTKQDQAAFRKFLARQRKIEAKAGRRIRAAGRYLTRQTAQSVRT
jgi:hypothetical protein